MSNIVCIEILKSKIDDYKKPIKNDKDVIRGLNCV